MITVRHTYATHGFTLVEMLTTLSILGALSMISAPSMIDFMAAQRVKTAASDLVTSLTRTRSEAIKRNATATLAPSGSWSSGWVVSADSQPLDTHVLATAVIVSGPTNDVTYRALGRLGAGETAQFSISSTHTTTARCVQVTLSGQPRVTPGACQ